MYSFTLFKISVWRRLVHSIGYNNRIWIFGKELFSHTLDFIVFEEQYIIQNSYLFDINISTQNHKSPSPHGNSFQTQDTYLKSFEKVLNGKIYFVFSWNFTVLNKLKFFLSSEKPVVGWPSDRLHSIRARQDQRPAKAIVALFVSQQLLGVHGCCCLHFKKSKWPFEKNPYSYPAKLTRFRLKIFQNDKIKPSLQYEPSDYISEQEERTEKLIHRFNRVKLKVCYQRTLLAN